MRPESSLVDTAVQRAKRIWQLARFLRAGAILGLITCAAFVLLGVAIVRGLISDRAIALTILAGIGATSVVAGAIVIRRLLSKRRQKVWLAAEVERADPRFQDRLNTLLFLESKAEPGQMGFASRIAEQARRLVRAHTPGAPFSLSGSAAWCAFFLAGVASTCLLNQRYAPWTHLRVSTGAAPPRVHGPAPLASIATNIVEPSRSWGEVRITDPGRDLRATKVDVVPLTIEAAADHNLRRIGWYSSVNGNPEQAHDLPSPSDPKYATYQPTLYLDQLALSDWDVLSYYAKAETDETNRYTSEVYFIEVRPFREDILKMPGGEKGRPYRTLSEISSLIGRQQHVIRDTHQFAIRTPDGDDPAARTLLSETELELGQSVQHLYAEMAGTMENEPIGAALENLAKAQSSLQNAGDLLKSDPLPLAQTHERGALSELVAARKVFQRAIAEHPGDFTPNGDNDAAPIADASKKLSEMAEFRDENKSATEFLQKLAAEQKQLEQSSRQSTSERGSLADHEQELDRSLKGFREEHPRPFKDMGGLTDEAAKSLRRAGERLKGGADDGPAAAGEATRKLEQLQAAVSAKASGQNLADSYGLRQLLEQQIQALDKLAGSSPKDGSALASQTARMSRKLIDQLRKAADSHQEVGELYKELKQALSDKEQSELDQELTALEQAKDDTERRAGAQSAKAGLERLDKALAANDPKSLQAARQTDSLKPEQGTGLEQGMSELEQLLRQLEQGGKPGGEATKQAREALSNIREGLSNQYGQDSHGADLISQLQGIVGDPHGISSEKLRALLNQLERFSVETRPKLAGGPNPNEVVNQDPAHFPAAYRERIEKYFEKLSEK